MQFLTNSDVADDDNVVILLTLDSAKGEADCALAVSKQKLLHNLDAGRLDRTPVTRHFTHCILNAFACEARIYPRTKKNAAGHQKEGEKR